MQVSQEAGKVVWYSHLSKNFPQFVVIHTGKGFHVVKEAEIDVFLEFPFFSYDPVDVGSLISGSSTFSKSSLIIWKFSIHVLLKPSLKDFEHSLLACKERKKGSEVARSCPTLCNPMDCSLPGSSIHGVFQARILEWVAFPSAGDLPDPGIELQSPVL